MRWFTDDYEDEYNEIVYEEEKEEEVEEADLYFDVPLPYRPYQIK